MPITKSAQKQLRKNLKAREKNTAEKVDAKKLLKAIDKLLQAKNTTEAQKKIQEAYSKLDRMVKKNLIHKKNAAHQKSQVMKKLNAAGK